jgi:hypothetical protein
MKVLMTLTEVVTHEITKEVEISNEEYRIYQETGHLPFDARTELKGELSGSITEDHLTKYDSKYVIEKK